MNDFLLNFTKIVESNTRIYWSILFGIAACLVLYVAEIVHIDQVIAALNTKDQQILRTAIAPLNEQYKWARIIAMVTAVVWSSWEYSKAKKKMGLSH